MARRVLDTSIYTRMQQPVPVQGSQIMPVMPGGNALRERERVQRFLQPREAPQNTSPDSAPFPESPASPSLAQLAFACVPWLPFGHGEKCPAASSGVCQCGFDDAERLRAALAKLLG